MLAWRLKRETRGQGGRSVVYDFHIVGHADDGCVIVCVFFAPVDRILAYVRVLEQAEIIPREVTLSTQGLVDWVTLASPGEESSYILHAEAGAYEFCVTQAGSPVFSRTFCLPGGLTDRSAFLLREVKVSFEMFRRLKRMPGEAFKGLHVVGRLDRQEAAALAPFLKSLHEEKMRGAIGVPSPQACKRDVAFSSAIGLVLRSGNGRIDMMPPLLKQRIRRKIAWQGGLRCFVVCYCLIWAVFFSLWLGIVRHAQAKAVYQDIWLQAQPDVERFRAWAGRTAFWRDVWGPAGVSGILDEIFRNMPAGTVLTRMGAEQGVFSFSGLAPDAPTVLKLHGALSSSALFSDVLLDFVGQEARENMQKFSMRCAVKK